MSGDLVSGKIRQRCYRASPEQFGELLTSLESELSDAKAKSLDKALAPARANVRERKRLAELHPDHDELGDKADAAEAVLAERTKTETAELLPVVQYSTRDLDVSKRMDVADLVTQDFIQGKQAFDIALEGGLLLPTIRVSIDRLRGVTIRVSARDEAWAANVLSLARRDLRKQRPWWHWIKHPATQTIGWAIYLVCFLLQFLLDGPIQALPLSVVLLAMLPIALNTLLPAALIRETREPKKGRLLSFGKWFGTLLVGATLSYALTKFLG